MAIYSMECNSRKGVLLKELEKKIEQSNLACQKFLANLNACEYKCQEDYISGKIIGIIYYEELKSGFCRRKGLFKIKEEFDSSGKKVFNYFPDETTDKGKNLLAQIRLIPYVKEYELNLIFGVDTRQKAVNFRQIPEKNIYVIAIADKAPLSNAFDHFDMKQMSYEEMCCLLNFPK